MTAIWMRARSELRSRLFAVLSLAVIVGVLGGVVIAAAAGARRTETAYPRFAKAQNALDVVVSPFGKDRAEAFREIEHLPQVAQFSMANIFGASARTATGRQLNFPEILPIASADGRFGTTINALKILSGRAADPTRPDEVVASFSLAEKLALEPGDRIELGVFGNTDFFTPRPGEKLPPPIPVIVRGIGAAPGEFRPLAGGYIAGLHLTPAFYQKHQELFAPEDESLVLRLRRGQADMQAFRRGLKAIKQRLDVGFDLPFNQAQQTAGVQQATRAQSVALWVLALLVGVAGLAIFAQALARQTFLESTEYPTLRSLGLSPSQLLTVGLIRATAIGAIGATLAAGIAILLSPLTPTGLARIAEPDPGFDVNSIAVCLGAAGILLSVVLLGAFPAWRAARAAGLALGVVEPRGSRPSAVGGYLARLGAAPSSVAGVRMALEPGRGRTAVPVRTTMFGTTLGLFALAAALAFGASLHHLTSTPRLSGWNWDTIVGVDINGQVPQAEAEAEQRKLEAKLSSDPRIEEYAAGTLPDLTVGRVQLLALAMESRKGSVTPSLAEGELPSSPDEIALGAETMRSVGVGIGDTVQVRERGGTYPMEVVGRIAMPNFFFSFAPPGQGAAVSFDWVRQVDPQSAKQAAFLLRFAPGVNRRDVIPRLRSQIPDSFELPPLESQQVSNLGEVGNVPLALAGIVALMAAATLAHTLVTSIRRRRRDLAILKTIGFVRRQVLATVAWQATALTIVALAIGIPIGVMAGRWGWNAFAERLGVVPEPIVPAVAVLLVVPIAVVLANLISIVPGRIASRLRPGPVLRSE
jgi:putative ABC transport system permease protein